MAAEVYGEAGNSSISPPFQVSGVGGNLSTTVNKQTGVAQIFRANALNTQQSVGTFDPKTKKFTAQKDSNGNLILNQQEIKSLSSPTATSAISDAASKTATKGLIAEGKDPTTAKKEADSLTNPSAPTTTGETDGQAPATEEDVAAFGEELNSPNKEGTRTQYEDVRYPVDLALEHQDCIKFSILEYKPSLAKRSNTSTGQSISRIVEVKDGVPQIGKKPLGTITLPIPAGINDSNTVGWQEDTINKLQEQFGAVAQGFISGGAAGATPAAQGASNTFSDAVKSGDLQKQLSGMIAGAAVSNSSIQQRTTGTIFNNNLELLFNGPSLRSFAFSFKLSPRNAPEAKNIMKIIRFFKQAMSVKRSKTSLLLKTPHTFAISYITSNKQHPYLNKFKECALTGFNVDYTPEGQYMTYMSSDIDERSMISYQISLTFQELEPVFDDDYGNEAPQNILNVGY
jgi:hypothetical protein